MKLTVLCAALLVPVAAVPLASLPASAAHPSRGLMEDVRRDLDAFARIAREHGGNRAAGTRGFDGSVSYVVAELRRAGYAPAVQPFTYPDWAERDTPEFARTAPRARPYVHGTDFVTMEYSGSGDVTARAVPVDVPAAGQAGTAACEAADFARFPRGAIALVQRGACEFSVKVTRARAAGASAVVVYNRSDARSVAGGTLQRQRKLPVVSTSYSIGSALVRAARKGTLRLHVRTKAGTVRKHGANVLADTSGGASGRVVVVGAHLDSIPEGPGINDNATGVAAVLAAARRMSRTPLRNRVRFAFWGAEEDGLRGSEHYVTALPKAERAKIALALNFDMLGSVNGVRGVYDGDASLGAEKDPPAGSGAIEAVFRDYYASRDLPVTDSPYTGRSDYGPFVKAGIPAGGMESGADGNKTTAEARTYGGKAGDPYDPCYHTMCDTVKNVDFALLETMADGVLHAVRHFSAELP
ncbi:M20/M25/M40 family metallo-hydrolase [Actinomadura rubteroloni]|uniref:M20/M25/M40 family metallo-hydrolase n=1 Tax=Actinomadura rubteroloni TaxID=1926885 RepID=UPI001F404839|nr:M20/M25/M40 family metallo-hydrolase [Actinomadura rubteroloni]